MAGRADVADWWRRQTDEDHPTLINGGSLRIHEDGTRAINEGLGLGSFGHVIWDAALSLAAFFQWEQARGALAVERLRCLELGAGTGVPGLTLAQLGVRSPASFSAPLAHCLNLPWLLALRAGPACGDDRQRRGRAGTDAAECRAE